MNIYNEQLDLYLLVFARRTNLGGAVPVVSGYISGYKSGYIYTMYIYIISLYIIYNHNVRGDLLSYGDKLTMAIQNPTAPQDFDSLCQLTGETGVYQDRQVQR